MEKENGVWISRMREYHGNRFQCRIELDGAEHDGGGHEQRADNLDACRCRILYIER
jgi:hypothetical protein